jgi:hypothetical protein
VLHISTQVREIAQGLTIDEARQRVTELEDKLKSYGFETIASSVDYRHLVRLPIHAKIFTEVTR